MVISARKVSTGKWVKDSAGYKYRYKSGAYAKNTWLNIGGSIYRFGSDGCRRTGSFKWNGKSYYAEVITADGTEIAYCFDGDNLVYIVMNVSGVQIAEKVNEISGHFPAQVDPELPMSYDEVMNLPMRG